MWFEKLTELIKSTSNPSSWRGKTAALLPTSKFWKRKRKRVSLLRWRQQFVKEIHSVRNSQPWTTCDWIERTRDIVYVDTNKQANISMELYYIMVCISSNKGIGIIIIRISVFSFVVASCQSRMLTVVTLRIRFIRLNKKVVFMKSKPGHDDEDIHILCYRAHSAIS